MNYRVQLEMRYRAENAHAAHVNAVQAMVNAQLWSDLVEGKAVSESRSSRHLSSSHLLKQSQIACRLACYLAGLPRFLPRLARLLPSALARTLPSRLTSRLTLPPEPLIYPLT